MKVQLLHPYHLLHHAVGESTLGLKGIIELDQPKKCSLCGYEATEGTTEHQSGKFSDYDAFSVKENMPFLCLACAFGLKHLVPLHKKYLLTASGITFLQYEDEKEGKVLHLIRQGQDHHK